MESVGIVWGVGWDREICYGCREVMLEYGLIEVLPYRYPFLRTGDGWFMDERTGRKQQAGRQAGIHHVVQHRSNRFHMRCQDSSPALQMEARWDPQQR